MLYNPPLGGGVNDPYIDGNPATGVEGSDVPAAAIEYPQREIINALTAAGLNPSNGDLTQLLQAIKLLGAVNAPADGGRLQYASATQLKYVPSKADYAKVNGVLVPIPAAGVPIANTGVEVGGVAAQNLAANSNYDLYLKSTAGVLAPSFYLDAGGGTHMSDTTAGNIGTEVRSNAGVPDSTRSIIAKVRTNGAGQFQLQSAGGFINWFNSEQVAIAGANTSGASTASGTPVEIATAARITILTWGGKVSSLKIVGYAANSAPGCGFEPLIGIDGAVVGTTVAGTSAAAGNSNPALNSYDGVLSEGSHVISPWGMANLGGTATFNVAAYAVVRG